MVLKYYLVDDDSSLKNSTSQNKHSRINATKVVSFKTFSLSFPSSHILNEIWKIQLFMYVINYYHQRNYFTEV